MTQQGTTETRYSLTLKPRALPYRQTHGPTPPPVSEPAEGPTATAPRGTEESPRAAAASPRGAGTGDGLGGAVPLGPTARLGPPKPATSGRGAARHQRRPPPERTRGRPPRPAHRPGKGAASPGAPHRLRRAAARCPPLAPHKMAAAAPLRGRAGPRGEPFPAAGRGWQQRASGRGERRGLRPPSADASAVTNRSHGRYAWDAGGGGGSGRRRDRSLPPSPPAAGPVAQPCPRLRQARCERGSCREGAVAGRLRGAGRAGAASPWEGRGALPPPPATDTHVGTGGPARAEAPVTPPRRGPAVAGKRRR